MLFMFNSLDERTDIKDHPKFNIVINNVSKDGDDFDSGSEGKASNKSAKEDSSLTVE